jgi:hypothetical protein
MITNSRPADLPYALVPIPTIICFFIIGYGLQKLLDRKWTRAVRAFKGECIHCGYLLKLNTPTDLDGPPPADPRLPPHILSRCPECGKPGAAPRPRTPLIPPAEPPSQ